MHLAPCTRCDRHVRADASRCPFCDAPYLAPAPAPFVPTPRVGRAALLAFRTLAIGAAGATAGCGASTGLDDGTADAAPGLEDAGATDAGVAPTDAGTPLPDAGFDAGTIPIPLYGAAPLDAGTDAGVLAMYGGPTPFDAGTDGGGAMALYGGPTPIPVERDAGDDGGAIVNAYGAPSP